MWQISLLLIGTVSTIPSHLLQLLPVLHKGNLNVSTLTVSLQDSSKILSRSPVHLHGSKLIGVDRGLTGARHPLTFSDRQSPRSSINDNYCVSCVAGNPVRAHVTGKGTCCVNCVTRNRNCVCVTRKKDSLVTQLARKKDCFVTGKKEPIRTLTLNSCVSTKERCKSQLLLSVSRNKACERCFLCRSVVFCKMSQMSQLLFQICL